MTLYRLPNFKNKEIYNFLASCNRKLIQPQGQKSNIKLCKLNLRSFNQTKNKVIKLRSREYPVLYSGIYTLGSKTVLSNPYPINFETTYLHSAQDPVRKQKEQTLCQSDFFISNKLYLYRVSSRICLFDELIVATNHVTVCRPCDIAVCTKRIDLLPRQSEPKGATENALA